MTTPAAIEVEDVHKTFRIPTNRAHTLRDRVTNPLARRGVREHAVLRGVSVSIDRGEFFGVVGRNGSGKSTLLKLIASIYRADRGRIRLAGRLAPFIELGVGFHPELAAYENVVLNGVMMGLTPREARRRFDAVIDFAELAEFKELKLRNYSSGMRVRLAFAVMVQVDADVLLIDEVLAVGDAAFQEKCMGTFRDLRARGKTIVFVTHSMANIAEFCHRAILLERGLIDTAGDPDAVAARYNALNSERAAAAGRAGGPAGVERPEQVARLHDVWVENELGTRVTRLPTGTPIGLCAELEALGPIEPACFAFSVSSRKGARLVAPPSTELGALRSLGTGERVTVRVRLGNPFAPGEYELACAIKDGDMAAPGAAASNILSVPLLVTGTPSRGLLVGVEHDVELTHEAGLGAVGR